MLSNPVDRMRMALFAGSTTATLLSTNRLFHNPLVALNPTGLPCLLVADALLSLGYTACAKPSKFVYLCALLRCLRLGASELIPAYSPLWSALLASGIGLADLFWAHEHLYLSRKELGWTNNWLVNLPGFSKAVLIAEINVQLAAIFVTGEPSSLIWQSWAAFVISTYAASQAMMAKSGFFATVMTVFLGGLAHSQQNMLVRSAALIGLTSASIVVGRQASRALQVCV